MVASIVYIQPQPGADEETERLAKELGGLRGRLNNPKFVESAPEAVVAEAQANLALREEEEAKLVAAIGRLDEIE